jgi:hypothetical protein
MSESAKVQKLYHLKSLPSADALMTQEIGEFQDVMLMGYDKDGCLRYCATKGLKVADLFYLMDNVKHDILTGNAWDRTNG